MGVECSEERALVGVCDIWSKIQFLAFNLEYLVEADKLCVISLSVGGLMVFTDDGFD